MLAVGHYPGMEVANERGCGWKEAAAFQPSWGNLRAGSSNPQKGQGQREKGSGFCFFIFFIVNLLENVVRSYVTSASGGADPCFLSSSMWLALEKCRGS